MPFPAVPAVRVAHFPPTGRAFRWKATPISNKFHSSMLTTNEGACGAAAIDVRLLWEKLVSQRHARSTHPAPLFAKLVCQEMTHAEWHDKLSTYEN
jgi:hypothetical protein